LVAACIVVCVAMLGLMTGGAYADPAGGDGGVPSQDQVNQAQQAVTQAQSAVTPVQAQLNVAQSQLDDLDRQAQIAAQQYDEATVRLQQAEIRAQQAAAWATAAQARYAGAHNALAELAAAAYRDDNGLELVSLILAADGPQEYVDRAAVLQRAGIDRKATVIEAESAQQTADVMQKNAAAALLSQQSAQTQVAVAAQHAQAAVATEQSQLAAVTAHRDQLLAQLATAQNTSVALEQQRQQGLAEEAARAAALAAAKANQPQIPELSQYNLGVAAQALSYAYAQIGKPYVWGATGPDSFDCSGLTMRAWEQAGVDLPHFAAFQYQASHPLGYADLKPGDLLFWATDGNDSNTIYHEAIYIGGQQMIQAPLTGEDVEISSMWMWGSIQFFARPY
jgi:peptidoglycan DL-endopeptidase CwlO